VVFPVDRRFAGIARRATPRPAARASLAPASGVVECAAWAHRRPKPAPPDRYRRSRSARGAVADARHRAKLIAARSGRLQGGRGTGVAENRRARSSRHSAASFRKRARRENDRRAKPGKTHQAEEGRYSFCPKQCRRNYSGARNYPANCRNATFRVGLFGSFDELGGEPSWVMPADLDWHGFRRFLFRHGGNLAGI